MFRGNLLPADLLYRSSVQTEEGQSRHKFYFIVFKNSKTPLKLTGFTSDIRNDNIRTCLALLQHFLTFPVILYSYLQCVMDYMTGLVKTYAVSTKPLSSSPQIVSRDVFSL